MGVGFVVDLLIVMFLLCVVVDSCVCVVVVVGEGVIVDGGGSWMCKFIGIDFFGMLWFDVIVWVVFGVLLLVGCFCLVFDVDEFCCVYIGWFGVILVVIRLFW